VLFGLGDAFSVRSGLGREAAYSVGLGRHVLDNLLTYAGWTIHIAYPLVRGYTDAVDPPALPWGAALLALWAAGLLVPALRRRGWLAAGGFAAALLAPVLPLRNHTYHYYLVAPLLAAAWGAAMIADAALVAFAGRPRSAGARASGPPRRAAGAAGAAGWIAGLALAALAGTNGALLVHRNETQPLGATSLRADPTVDRAIIAGNVRDGLAAADLPEGATLVLWIPRVFQAGLPPEVVADTTRDTYWERNLRSALMDGLAVRVLFPRVRGVRFARTFRPDATAPRWGVVRTDGVVQVTTQERLAEMLSERTDIR
jgi:hypothetical protein